MSLNPPKARHDAESCIHSELARPRLRYIEAFPVLREGEQVVCIRDPLRIAENILALPPAALFIASMMDGSHSIEDIQAECLKQFRQTIPRNQIEELIAQLDAELYLESQHFRRALREIERAYHEAPYREPFHAGGAYEAEPVRLREQLHRFQQAIPPDAESGKGHLTALVSPHIDLHRGGPCFAYAYRELAAHEPAELYLIFGTGHQSRSSLFIPTRKSYNTPLGSIQTDEDFIDRLIQQAPMDVTSEELLHRNEHSIEFQALWLRHILGEENKGKIAPILTGSLHRFIFEGRSPRSDKNVADTLDLLREMVDEYPGKVVIIAGADMSHVGKRFGNELGIPDTELERVRKEDETVLDAMTSADPEAFFASIEQIKDQNNICGLAPIYMMLDIARPQTGRILNYDRAIETESESVVTFVSASFYS